MKILAMTCCCVDIFPETGRILPGGNALNLAVACVKTGKSEVFLTGNIGKDAYGKIIKTAADKYKINSSRLYEVIGQTANHTINIDEKGDRYFKENSWVSGVWADYRISESDKKFMQSMDVIATTFYESEFEKIIDAKRKSGFLLSADFHEEKMTPNWEKYFDALDLFFISGKKQDSPEFRKSLKSWSKKFKTVFIATFGENGSVAYKDGKEYLCEAEKVNNVFDTTGCGDSYHGAFIVEYVSNNKNIEKSMKSASVSAAKTLSFNGGFEY